MKIKELKGNLHFLLYIFDLINYINSNIDNLKSFKINIKYF